MTGRAQVENVNEVRLEGRVSADPVEIVLPSGDVLWTFRVVVSRPAAIGDRTRVDALECRAVSGRVQRSVSTWRAGDRVEVFGSLRRRFFVTGGRRESRTEVEVIRARMVRRSIS